MPGPGPVTEKNTKGYSKVAKKISSPLDFENIPPGKGSDTQGKTFLVLRPKTRGNEFQKSAI